jgi:hypothetical protein
MRGVVLWLFLVEEAAEEVAAVVDCDQESVLRTKLNPKLGGQEQTVKPADLLGAESVTDLVWPAFRIFVGDHHLALVRAAGGCVDESGRVLGFEVWIGESGQEVILVRLQREVGAKVRDRRAEIIPFEIATAQAVDKVVEPIRENL